MATQEIRGGESKKNVSKEFYNQEANVLGFSDVIVPVFDVTKRNGAYVGFRTVSSASSVIIYTARAGKEVFLSSITIAYQKDALNDATSCFLGITPEEENALRYFYVPVKTLTSDDVSMTFNLPFPVKLKPGTSILFTMAYGAGTGEACIGLNLLVKESY